MELMGKSNSILISRMGMWVVYYCEAVRSRVGECLTIECPASLLTGHSLVLVEIS